MTDERSKQDKDPLVAEVYRSLADERVPENLNRRVLKMAARPARTPYSRTRSWTTPLAWAATIGLSLALVLELTRLPGVEPQSSGIATPDIQINDLDTTTTSAGDSAEAPTAIPETEIGNSQRAGGTARPDEVSRDEFVPKGIDVLQEAEDIARTRAGPRQTTRTAPADTDLSPVEKSTSQRAVPERRAPESDTQHRAADDAVVSATFSATAMTSEMKMIESEGPCAPELRETPESWLACIAALRDKGQTELAELESREFQRIYPDLPVPRPDR